MPDAPKKKLKKVKRPGVAHPQPPHRVPEAAIPVAVEEAREEELPATMKPAAEPGERPGAVAAGAESLPEQASAPVKAETAPSKEGERAVPEAPGREEAAVAGPEGEKAPQAVQPVPGSRTAATVTPVGDMETGPTPSTKEAEAPGEISAAQAEVPREHVKSPPEAPERAVRAAGELPEEKWEILAADKAEAGAVERTGAGLAEEEPAAMPGAEHAPAARAAPVLEPSEAMAPESELRPAAEEERPRSEAVAPPLEEEQPLHAFAADDELQRLKADFSRKLFQLELDKERLQEIGNELATRGDDLENQVREIAAREEALRKQDAEIAKKGELVNASSEALSVLEEDLRAKEKKVQSSEDEVRRLRQEFDALQAELSTREQKVMCERSEMDGTHKKVEVMLSEISSREAALKQGESDSAKKMEQLALVRKEAEELDARLRAQDGRLRKKEDELKALEQHLLSIEEEVRLCPHCNAVEEFHHLALRSDELRSRGEDTGELNLEIKSARMALREGLYDSSTDHARRAAELLRAKELESERRNVVAKVMATEGLMKMLRDAKADVTSIQNAVTEAWVAFKVDQLQKAETLADRGRREAMALEQERFQALDELVRSNSQLEALKKSGVNVQAAEKRREEAERAMAAGDFRRARIIASETVVMASEAAQSQDVATAMSQIKLAEETLEELRALGLDASEWDRTVNRSREFLKKLDFKSAEETARWVRQKAREEARMYRQALLTLDHCNSILMTYKDMGLMVRKAEDLHEEAKAKLREGDPELALNLAKKAEKMVREISERQKGAQTALKKASNLIRGERKSGKDITKSEKLYDLAQHQLELGEYANAMKLANKSVEALSGSSATALELCPTCGEAIPENAPDCPSCAERNRRKEREQAVAPKDELARRTRLGVKGGRKYACPYCGDLFEISVPGRPITITCPWCGYEVSVVE